jgi:hypothetical protein
MMRSMFILTQDEWESIDLLIAAATSIKDAADNGTLKGAVNREAESGANLMRMLADLHSATSGLPTSLYVNEDEDTGS